ncbi:MAG: glycosyltransferase [Phycisphaerae bacterium]
MIHGRTIICIANRWDYDPTSKHHVMRTLSATNQIVWVNYRGSRKPTASRRDLGAILATVGQAIRGPRRIDDAMVQVTPLLVPGSSRRLVQNLNRRMVVAQIRRALARLPKRPVQLWTFAPNVDFLAGRFDEEALIYYCVDDFGAFEDHDGQAIRSAESRLIQKADAVITTSQELFDSHKDCHRNTHLVRHGVDWSHFAAAADRQLDPPADIGHLPGPVLGFFGLLHHWFDVELLARVARSRPQYTFVLIGDCHADATALHSLPNVHPLGRRSYDSLPAYCAAFDAALLPFRINDMTRNINPIKLREYLAAGLPVVSTPLPEAVHYAPDVLTADTAQGFSAACDRAVSQSTLTQRLQRSARVADESWQNVVERLSLIAEDAVGRRRRKRAQPTLPSRADIAATGASPNPA